MSFNSIHDPFRCKHVSILNKEFKDESLSKQIEKQLYKFS